MADPGELSEDEEQLFVLLVPAEAGRLDRWLAGELPLSRSRIQALAVEGRVELDGRVVKGNVLPAEGQEVRVRVPPPPPSELQAEAIPVPLLHLDEDLLVVDKPAGLVVHPARGHAQGTLVHALLHLLIQAGGDPVRPGVVHRLDKGTSGTMVVARRPEAHEALAADFAVHAIERRYLALCWGGPATERGSVDAPIGRHPRDRLRFAVVEGGRRSLTHWAVRSRVELPIPGSRLGGALCLVECRLETGRTHQVRVHLSSIGLPLVGDPVYRGRPTVPASLRDLVQPLERPLLHAWHLGFRHPRTGAWMSFRTPPPPDFLAVAAAAGLRVPAEPGRDLGRWDMPPMTSVPRIEEDEP